MFKEINNSINRVKLLLTLSILVFLLTFNELNSSGLILILAGAIIYAYHTMLQARSEGVVRQGLYRYIRHPAFLGLMLVHLGIAISINSLIFGIYTLGLVIPYLYLRASVEDEVISSKETLYALWMRHTKMFIPGII